MESTDQVNKDRSVLLSGISWKKVWKSTRKYLRGQAAINAKCKLVEECLFDLQLISIINKCLLDTSALFPNIYHWSTYA